MYKLTGMGWTWSVSGVSFPASGVLLALNSEVDKVCFEVPSWHPPALKVLHFGQNSPRKRCSEY